MKKISLLNLLFMLSFYHDRLISKPEFVFQDNLLLNGMHYAIGLLGIKACDSKNHVEIKANAVINGAHDGYLGYKNFRDILKNYRDVQESTNALGQARNAGWGLLNLQLLVDQVKFFYQNLKVFQKSKKIAKFNRHIKLNLTNEKIKQVIWLTFNTALPSLCFAVKRRYYDNIPLKNAFYKDAMTFNSRAMLSLSSEGVRYGATLLAMLSEHLRRYTLYKKVKKETQRRLQQSYR